jgi:hypothetical protein
MAAPGSSWAIGVGVRRRAGRPPIGWACTMLVLAWLALAALLAACTTGEEQEAAVEQDVIGLPTILPKDDQLGPAMVERCPALTAPQITDLAVRQAPALDEPPARLPFVDPVFGTCVVRATDRVSDPDPSDPSPGLKNEYARIQSFNADGSLILVRGIEASWYAYDADSLRPLARLPFDGSVDPRWDPEQSYRLYYNEETALLSYDLLTGERALIHDFAADLPGMQLAAVGMRHEGSPSLDGRYWGLMAQDRKWRAVALLVYDRQLDRVTAVRRLARAPDLDSVSITPLGDYFLAFFDYCEAGLGTVERPCGLMRYDRDLSAGRGLLRVVGHADVALDAQGRQVLVYQDIDTDHISMLDLESGAVTRLWAIDFSHTALGLHFSGRAFRQPGWALVSTYNGGHPEDRTWMDNQVFAVELKASGRVFRLAHTHSVVDESQEHDYWAEPHATVDPDFRRILFTSNWGRSGSAEVETYLIFLPGDWLSSDR